MDIRDEDERADLQAVIERMHHCKSRWLTEVPIVESHAGTTVWEGVVHVFELLDHPTASRCYAWAHETEVLSHLNGEGVRVGRAGYGWRYSEETDEAGRGLVEPVAEERRLATRARALASRGHSLREIARRFNAAGVATKRGGRWHACTIGVLVG